MESKDTLRDLDLAAARPFIEYPETPWWYPVLMGGYFAAIATALFLGAGGHNVVELAILVVAVVIMGVFFGWYRSRWGTWPQMTEAPPEIRRAYRIAVVGAFVAVVLMVVVGMLLPPEVVVPAIFIVFTAVVWVYERKIYPAACDAVRARLA